MNFTWPYVPPLVHKLRTSSDEDKQLSDLITDFMREGLYLKYFSNSKVGQVIGSGEYSTCTKDVVCATGDEVAVKIMETKLRENEHILREVKALQKLRGRSEYVVQLIGLTCRTVRSKHLQVGLAMNMAATNLHDWIHSAPRTPVENSRAFLHVLKGVRAIHSANIMHRDLKPANVLAEVTASGEAVFRVCDFGLCCEYPTTRTLTTGAEMTTLNYRAPEIAKGRTHYGPKVDQWSLGCVLYELFSGGERLFPGQMGVNENRDLLAAHNSYAQERPPDSDVSYLLSFLICEEERRATSDEMLSILYKRCDKRCDKQNK